MKPLRIFSCFIALVATPVGANEGGSPGYYRFPALHGKTIAFTAEGDLWTVPSKGGTAQRLTTHLELETRPEFSPDGRTIAFSAFYEGPGEIYTVPASGGRPERVTYEGYSGFRSPYPAGWKSNTEILYATRYFARRDPYQIAVANIETKTQSVLPLEQASDGVYDARESAIYFTRLPRQFSHAKRYRGGLIENLWRYETGGREAVPLTADYAGTSRSPMLWKDRLYFVTDRDGTMNIWSMVRDGGDLKQHTKFAGWDVLSPNLHKGRIVFQNGADIWEYNIAADVARMVPIRLASDLDQTRERWLDDPLKYLDEFAVSKGGKRVVLTVRGRAFVAPAKSGRLIRIPQEKGTRYRSAAFLSGVEDESVFLLSDQTGETDFWSFPVDGLGPGKQITGDGKILRYNGAASPDGKFVAYTDRDQVLWVLDVTSGESRKITQSEEGSEFDEPDLSWSPDSRWLAFVDYEANMAKRIFLFDVTAKGDDNAPVPITTDRLDSYSPAWGPKGKWLYFLSDRTFRSVQSSPWGPRQPEAYLDKTTGVYLLDLAGGQRSPFTPEDELSAASKTGVNKDDGESKNGKDGKNNVGEADPPKVVIKFDGVTDRLHAAPVKAGNFGELQISKAHLYFRSKPLGLDSEKSLVCFPISRDKEKHKLTTVASGAGDFRISGDGSTVVLRKKKELFAFPASGKAPDVLSKTKVDLSAIGLNVSPADEWRQMFVDAWRLHRDYFYDPAMHKVDWTAVRKKHEALLPRVSDRWELDDLIAQMVGELSAMHTNISSGDVREGDEGASMSYLGTRLARSKKAGGYRVEHIYRNDPDHPSGLAPVAQPGVDIVVGDVITAIDGVATLSVDDPAVLLRNKAGRQVLLETRRKGTATLRKFLVKPLDNAGFRNLKLGEWEYTRRLETERRGKGDIGYFHMRAMSGSNYSEFVKGFYPVFNRKGLVIDMRQNYGGNIDSWILGRLTRKAWMFWQARTGRPSSNMQYAFNGHMVVLIDAYTISDGEAFSEGFRSLGLGPLIGTQTWGGGIWLRSSNNLVDGGVARSPEFGVYSPSRLWLIEGEGLEPDIEVDNLPHEAFEGKDAQLETAITYLKKKIAKDPPGTPPPPPYPDKSFKYEAGKD